MENPIRASPEKTTTVSRSSRQAYVAADRSDDAFAILNGIRNDRPRSNSPARSHTDTFRLHLRLTPAILPAGFPTVLDNHQKIYSSMAASGASSAGKGLCRSAPLPPAQAAARAAPPADGSVRDADLRKSRRHRARCGERPPAVWRCDADAVRESIRAGRAADRLRFTKGVDTSDSDNGAGVTWADTMKNLTAAFNSLQVPMAGLAECP